MCTLNDFMRYAHVFSKTYQIPKDKIDLALKDFFEQVMSVSARIASLPFFTMHELPEEWVLIKIHISMKNPPTHIPEGLHYDSYFYIDQMASLAICNDDIQKQSAESYDKLLMFLEQNNLAACTPIFCIMSGDDTLKYTFFKVGYTEKQAA